MAPLRAFGHLSTSIPVTGARGHPGPAIRGRFPLTDLGCVDRMAMQKRISPSRFSPCSTSAASGWRLMPRIPVASVWPGNRRARDGPSGASGCPGRTYCSRYSICTTRRALTQAAGHAGPVALAAKRDLPQGFPHLEGQAVRPKGPHQAAVLLPCLHTFIPLVETEMRALVTMLQGQFKACRVALGTC